MKKIFALLPLLLLNIHSASAACTRGTITATVVQGVSIRKVSGMNFGRIQPRSSAECISLNDTRNRGEFVVTGLPSSSVQVTLPQAANLHFQRQGLVKRSKIIALEDLKASTTNLTLDASGRGTVYVAGCRDQAARNQQAGYYADDIQLNVVYSSKDILEPQASITDNPIFFELTKGLVNIATTAVQDLAFGKFFPGSGGSVIISTSGARSSVAGVTLVSGGSVHHEANFSVTGRAGANYAIYLPAGPITLVSGANTMSVNTFVSDPFHGQLGSSGSENVGVGGTLKVANGQAPGNYTGAFAFCAEYL